MRFKTYSYLQAPIQYGNQWCVLLGEDLQQGIAGFGASPEEAIVTFEYETENKGVNQ
jgi:hypothetical protein